MLQMSRDFIILMNAVVTFYKSTRKLLNFIFPFRLTMRDFNDILMINKTSREE